MLGSDFMPDYDRGDFQVGFKVEPGASLQAAKRKAEELEDVSAPARAAPNPEVEHVYTTIGTGLNGTITEGTLYVKLTERRRRGLVPIRRELRDRLRGVPGVETDVSAVAEFGESKPVNLAILSPDRRMVEQAEPLVLEAMRGVDGAVDIASSRDKGRPELRLAVDRRRASDLGVSPMAVASLVRPLVDGVDVVKYRGPGHRRAVRRDRAPVGPGPVRAAQLRATALGSTKKDKNDHNLQVKLDSVARFEETTAPAKLERRALQTQILVTANKEGRTLNEVTGDVTRRAEQLRREGALPAGTRLEWVGSARDNQETAGYMATAMLLAVFFIYFVLASQFESFKLPITIMLSLPLSMVGMVMMLLVTGDNMSMMTSIGMILLMGLVTKNAILLVDHAPISNGRKAFRGARPSSAPAPSGCAPSS